MATVALHRIVAFTFLGAPPSPFHTVDHRDRVRENNRVENLVWVDIQAQLSNRETSSYVLVADGGRTFTTLTSLADYVQMSSQSLSSLLRQAKCGDTFGVNGRSFCVQSVQRQLMAAPTTSTKLPAAKRPPGKKRAAEALDCYVYHDMGVSCIAANMGLCESTVLSYIGKAARESDVFIVQSLASRLGLKDGDVRQRMRDALTSMVPVDKAKFDESYRRVILQFTDKDWRVVRQRFRTICKAFGDSQSTAVSSLLGLRSSGDQQESHDS
jgi:hypothetical protein